MPHAEAPSDRRLWLDAVHLTAQAINELRSIGTGPSFAESIDRWEYRHRDRIGRWAFHALSLQPGPPAERPEGSR